MKQEPTTAQKKLNLTIKGCGSCCCLKLAVEAERQRYQDLFVCTRRLPSGDGDDQTNRGAT